MVNAKTSFILATHSLLCFVGFASNVDSLSSESKNALDQWHLPAAKQFAFEALSEARQLGDQHGEATASYRLANAFQASENYQGASPHYQRALELADILQDTSLLAKVLCSFSAMKQTLGDLPSAKSNAEHSLKLAENIEDTLLQAFNYLRLGNILAEQEDWAEAISHYNRAIALSQSFGNEALEAGARQNLSEAFAYNQNWELAEQQSLEAIALRIKLSDEYHINKCFENLLAQKLRKKDIDAFLAVQQRFLETLKSEEMRMTVETTAALADMTIEQQDLISAYKRWIAGTVGACGLIALLLLLQWIRYRKLQKHLNERLEKSALRILQMESASAKHSLSERVKPLKEHSNPMLVNCYLMLSVGYSRAELSELFGRDRTTIHRWIEQMSKLLNVEDVQSDALEYGQKAKAVL